MRKVKKIKASQHLFASKLADFNHQMGDTIKIVHIKSTPILYWYEIIYDEVFGELWKDIPGFNGLYQASNMGRIKGPGCGKKKIKGCILRGYSGEETGGYLIHTFSVKKKPTTIRAHRVVAQAWVPNPDKLPDVGHMDKIRTNNWPENLYWK